MTINLSILDFKIAVISPITIASIAINLSILDFKKRQ